MMNIKFAVVREDPSVEQAILNLAPIKNVLMIASGGCTALSLKSLFPNIRFQLFDNNPNQIQLVKEKVENLQKNNHDSFKKLFNIGCDVKTGLNNCGEFESLFRSFRKFLTEFILSQDALENILLKKSSNKNLINNKYWPVAFDLFFSNSLLLAMFGPDAIQHAKPNSYPRYFQNALEKGLCRNDVATNYFLHHIFLGRYIDSINSLPYYLYNNNAHLKFEYTNKTLLDISNIDQFGLVSLSNIFDWMPEQAILTCLKYLETNLTPGSFVVFRQLNNDKNYLASISGFKSHNQLSCDLLIKDRSLFYNKINILEKI